VTPVSHRLLLPGPAGAIECVVEVPAVPMRPAGGHLVRGLALVCHPHPLYGGSLDNKVASTLARAFLSQGWACLRPNFRGVGESAGTHDEGAGETSDMEHLLAGAPGLEQLAGLLPPSPPVALAGFSFGSFVAARLAQARADQGLPTEALVLVGAAAGKWDMPRVPEDTLLVHGEQDEVIALSAVFDWARAGGNSVVVLPGADHFFHRRTAQLKQLVVRHLAGLAAERTF
jgi:alpha/beta superfamily hydrolase